ncbi:hypothetical protein SLS55_007292 [Diplodia seriata]|uniref:BTB domain-containing protein n=1 Tax=Diplodia seriata TaxID=420778 RepID=A0ABR3CD56_9PEZI
MSGPDPELQSTEEDEEEDITSLPTREEAGREMLESGYLADTTVVCADGQEIMAHSHLLVCYSVYFRNAFKSGMQESKHKKFKLENSSSDPHLNLGRDVVYRALEYLYSGSCTEHQDADAFSKNIHLYIDLHVLGDYLHIGGLRQYAASRFGELAEDWVQLRPVLPEAITAIYSKPGSVVSGIWPKLVVVLARQGRRLSHPDMADCIHTLRDYGDCAADVMLGIVQREVEKHCDRCGNSFTVVEGERKKSYFYCFHCGRKLSFD